MKRSKKAQVQKNSLIAAIAIASVIIITLMVGVINHSNQSYRDKYDTWYVSTHIKAGDTVYTIYDRVCDEHPDTVNMGRENFIKEVQELNGLNSDCEIRSGYYIIIPYLTEKEN